MAVDGDTSSTVLERLAPRRAAPKKAAHKAVSPGDQRLRANKPPLPLCDETGDKLKRERALWATKVFAVAAETMATHEGRLRDLSCSSNVSLFLIMAGGGVRCCYSSKVTTASW